MQIKKLPTIELSYEGNIGTITLNRPDQLNACNEQMIEDFQEITSFFNNQKNIKVVIVKGNGKSFCTGFDLSNFKEKTPSEIASVVAKGEKMIQAISNINAITIASIHRHCVGGGIVIAGACNLRYASSDTSFWLPETELGVPLAWGGMPVLVNMMGDIKALEFTLLCERWSALDMYEQNFLNQVVEPSELQEHIEKISNKLSQRSSMVLDITKNQTKAAKNLILPKGNEYTDAHLFLSALIDEESISNRADFFNK